MRIAMLHPSLVVRGGAENALVWLATELARRGHAVTIFTGEYDSRYLGDPRSLPFALRVLPQAGPLGLSWRSRARWERVAQVLARELADFDVLNPHNFPCHLWVWLARQRNPTLAPTLWYAEDFGFHSHVLDVQHPTDATRIARAPDFARQAWRYFLERPSLERLKELYRILRLRQIARWLEPLDRKAVHSLDLILPNSRFASGWIERLYGCRTRTCHLGMPTSRFESAGEPPASELVSCSITRLFPAKNVATILRALALLRDDARLEGHVHYVIGEGPQLGELQALADSLGLGSRVVFTGFPVPSLQEYLRRSRVFVHIPLEEPFGLVYLEAALLQVPSVASNQGGPAEIVEPMKTGMTVAPTDPAAVAEALRTLLLDPARARVMGAAARARALAEFSIEALADRFLRAVEDTLAGRQERPVGP